MMAIARRAWMEKTLTGTVDCRHWPALVRECVTAYFQIHESGVSAPGQAMTFSGDHATAASPYPPPMML